MVLISWLTGLDQIAPWLPFFVSIIFVGLPHGAADWLLLGPASRCSAIGTFLLYSLVGALVGLLAWLYPLPVILGFLLLTILHFGIADERDLRSFEASPSGSHQHPLFRYGGVGRIAVFLVLICYLNPEGVAMLFGRVGTLLGSAGLKESLVQSLTVASPVALFLACIAWALSLLGTIANRLRDGFFAIRKERLEVEIGEGILLIGAAFLLDPVFAVGAYFLGWHAARHCFLLANLFPAPTVERPGYAQSLLHVHLQAWPLYLPVVPLMLGLVWANGSLRSPLDWVASLLVVCIIFTVPHHVIVERRLPAIRKVRGKAAKAIPNHARSASIREIPEGKTPVTR